MNGSVAEAARVRRSGQRDAAGGRPGRGIGMRPGSADDLVVLLGLAGAGRVDERPPGPTTAGGLRRASRAGRRPARARSASCRRHLMSGSRRIVPSPEHGASSRTRSKTPRKGRRPRGVGLDDRARGRRPTARHGARAAARRGGRGRRPRPSRPRSPIAAAIVSRLAARRRAGVEDASRPADAAANCADELRRLVLDDERRRRVRAASAADCRACTTSASGAKRAGLGRRRRLAASAPPARHASCAACSTRSVSGAGVLLKRSPRLGRLEPVPRRASARPATRGCDSVTDR